MTRLLVTLVLHGAARLAQRRGRPTRDPFCAGLVRSDRDTNVLRIGAKMISEPLAHEVVRVWSG